MSLRELCDVAQIEWEALEDRRETLRLLALLVKTQPNVRTSGLDDYEPPSERITGILAGDEAV